MTTLSFSLDRFVQDPAADGAKIAVVVAHPDDEVLGCGILLCRCPEAQIIHVTDGAPREGDDAKRAGFSTPEAYGAHRRVELEAAAALAGIRPEQLIGLGIPDQATTRNLEPITRRLAAMLRDRDVVLTHAYEGGHPDHDATAFAVHAATRLLGEEAPVLIEMPLYRGEGDDALRQVFEPRDDAGPEVTLELTEQERSLKQQMYEAHASQARVLSGFPIGVERFRMPPAYDFTALPNGGLVRYERYGWGFTGHAFVEQASLVLDHLKAEMA